MPNSTQQYATAQEMAAKYRISVHTVRSRAAGGDWPCDRIGRLYRFSPAQQEEITKIIAIGRRPAYDRDIVAAALRQLTEHSST